MLQKPFTIDKLTDIPTEKIWEFISYHMNDINHIYIFTYLQHKLLYAIDSIFLESFYDDSSLGWVILDSDPGELSKSFTSENIISSVDEARNGGIRSRDLEFVSLFFSNPDADSYDLRIVQVDEDTQHNSIHDEDSCSLWNTVIGDDLRWMEVEWWVGDYTYRHFCDKNLVVDRFAIVISMK